jgi:uncharacterized protein with HEPN domain
LRYFDVPPTLEDRLQHVLDSIMAIERLLKSKTIEDYAGDQVLQAAVERFLERICEACRYIPNEVRSAEIPWQRMVGFGNLLRHAYHSIDARTVWEIATQDIAVLRTFVVRLIREAQRP